MELVARSLAQAAAQDLGRLLFELLLSSSEAVEQAVHNAKRWEDAGRRRPGGPRPGGR